MIDPGVGLQLATALVASVTGVYALTYVWEFAKRLLW